jgi:DNA invertase Pin-like site-specific DNA recombinase
MQVQSKVDLSDVISRAIASNDKVRGPRKPRAKSEEVEEKKKRKSKKGTFLSDLEEIRRSKRRRPNRPPKAWSYGRVSHRDQVDGESVPAQVMRCEAYYKFRLEKEGVEWGGACVEERNESARSTNFIQRPSGAALMKQIQRGDHIIVDKVDRIWRNVHDFANLLQLFKDIDVHVHFVSFSGCSIEIGTPMGDFFLTVIVATAQLESDNTSARIKAAFKHKKANGGYRSTYYVAGATATKVGDKKMSYVWDRQMRDWMTRIMEYEDANGGLTADFCRTIELEYRMQRRGMSQEEAEYFVKKTPCCKFYWSFDRSMRYAMREREYRFYGIVEPAQHVLYPLVKFNNMYEDPKAFQFVNPRTKLHMIAKGIVPDPNA